MALQLRAIIAIVVALLPTELNARDLGDARILWTEGFLSFHPDMRWRSEGLARYDEGRYALAVSAFKRAARYADKMSQAMLAEMYWLGTGVARDSSIAYVWMDLAVERGNP